MIAHEANHLRLSLPATVMCLLRLTIIPYSDYASNPETTLAGVGPVSF